MSESVRSYQLHVENFNGMMGLLTWQDPVRTSIAFGECLAVLALVQNGGILRFILYIGYFALGVTALVEFVTRWLNGGRSGLVTYFKPSQLIAVNKEHLQGHADTLVAATHEFLYWVRRVLDARDLKLTLTTFAGLWILYALTAVIPVSSMLMVGVIGAFTLPGLYYKFQAEFDHAHGHFAGIFNQHYQNYHGQAMATLDPHIQRYRSTRDAFGTIFGRGAGGAAPVAAAIPPPAAPRAPSVRSMRPPSKAPSVRSMKAASIRSQGMNPAMAAGAGALGGAAVGAGGMAMADQGSYYGSEYYDEGSMYGSEYSYMSEGAHHPPPPH